MTDKEKTLRFELKGGVAVDKSYFEKLSEMAAAGDCPGEPGEWAVKPKIQPKEEAMEEAKEPEFYWAATAEENPYYLELFDKEEWAQRFVKSTSAESEIPLLVKRQGKAEAADMVQRMIDAWCAANGWLEDEDGSPALDKLKMWKAMIERR